MAMTVSSANLALLRQQVTQLFVQTVAKQSVALQVSTPVPSSAANLRVPVVVSDPSTGWVAEGAEITPSDATLGEHVVTPKKVAGLTIVSNELVADTTPTASEIIAAGLARSCILNIDGAFFANTTTNGPPGIKSVTPTVVSAGGGWTDADPFIEAAYAIESVGASVDAWVANPADALLLASIKETTTSNRSLLEPDPTKPGRRVIGGTPLYISPAVTVGEVWGIPRDRVLSMIRKNITVEIDSSAYFSSDRTAIRATMRVGFGFPHPLGIVKVALDA